MPTFHALINPSAELAFDALQFKQSADTITYGLPWPGSDSESTASSVLDHDLSLGLRKPSSASEVRIIVFSCTPFPG